MTYLFPLQLPGRGTVGSPLCSHVMVTSKVFCIHQGTCLDIDHRIIVRRDHPFYQGIIEAILIESSETNSYPYPQLLIDANQIK
jgi:hypothetical protein